MRGSGIFRVLQGSLYGRLVIPLSLFVLLASIVMVFWMMQLYRRDSLRRFERMAVTNAGFVDSLPLPRSAEMAEKLSAILGVEVGFRGPEGSLARSGSPDDWPAAVEEVLAKAGQAEPTSLRAGEYDLALAPLVSSGRQLVLVRKRGAGWQGMGGWALVPVLVLTLASGGLVFILAHQIVRPLTVLTGWLPHLKSGERAEVAVPPNVTKRSDEIGILARSLEQTYQRLHREQERRRQSERMATLGQIATRLAHEVRNPAAAIQMHAELLAETAEGESIEAVSLIRQEVQRITDLVNQWLFVARAKPPEKRRHDLSELVDAVARRMEPALAHASVTLKVNSSPAFVACDRLRIEQVVRNLLVNAMQAMPRGGAIHVGVHGDGGEVELVVRDTGSGFSEEAMRRFGEPFFSEREGGMGIGLTLVNEVVRAHRGTIVPENQAEGGAQIRVTFPHAEMVEEGHPSP